LAERGRGLRMKGEGGLGVLVIRVSS